jgi:hypothetical protein
MSWTSCRCAGQMPVQSCRRRHSITRSLTGAFLFKQNCHQTAAVRPLIIVALTACCTAGPIPSELVNESAAPNAPEVHRMNAQCGSSLNPSARATNVPIRYSPLPQAPDDDLALRRLMGFSYHPNIFHSTVNATVCAPAQCNCLCMQAF